MLGRAVAFIAGTAALYIGVRAVVWFICWLGSFIYGYAVPAFTL